MNKTKNQSTTINGNVEQCSTFQVNYRIGNNSYVLQEGQMLPLWDMTRLADPILSAELVSRSALSYDDRYMIVGGTRRLDSHPKKEFWEEDTNIDSSLSELAYPGGIRYMRFGKFMGGLVDDGTSFIYQPMGVKVFHKNTCNAMPSAGFPFEIVAVCEKAPVGSIDMAGWNVCNGKTATYRALPLPIILSEAYPRLLGNTTLWQTAVKLYLLDSGVRELGLLYVPKTKIVKYNTDTVSDSVMYCNPKIEGALGQPTLDYQLYGRMQLFASGRFNPDQL
jgi:hypothetical protein